MRAALDRADVETQIDSSYRKQSAHPMQIRCSRRR
jgi:hypothetical protein